jgi:hypothetical protein
LISWQNTDIPVLNDGRERYIVHEIRFFHKDQCPSQLDLFSLDVLLIPIHLKNHWVASSIQFSKTKVEVYDSLGDHHPDILEVK